MSPRSTATLMESSEAILAWFRDEDSPCAFSSDHRISSTEPISYIVSTNIAGSARELKNREERMHLISYGWRMLHVKESSMDEDIFSTRERLTTRRVLKRKSVRSEDWLSLHSLHIGTLDWYRIEVFRSSHFPFHSRPAKRTFTSIWTRRKKSGPDYSYRSSRWSIDSCWWSVVESVHACEYWRFWSDRRVTKRSEGSAVDSWRCLSPLFQMFCTRRPRNHWENYVQELSYLLNNCRDNDALNRRSTDAEISYDLINRE